MNVVAGTEQGLREANSSASTKTSELHMREAGALVRLSYRLFVGWFGIGLAVPFFIWLSLWWLGIAPSMIEVFGITGIRIPASFTIAGLLLAAFGFYET